MNHRRTIWRKNGGPEECFGAPALSECKSRVSILSSPIKCKYLSIWFVYTACHVEVIRRKARRKSVFDGKSICAATSFIRDPKLPLILFFSRKTNLSELWNFLIKAFFWVVRAPMFRTSALKWNRWIIRISVEKDSCTGWLQEHRHSQKLKAFSF